MNRQPWTARCKSGYLFETGAPRCNRPAPRGMLLCSECLSAEVVPAPRRAARAYLRLVVAAIVALVEVF